LAGQAPSSAVIQAQQEAFNAAESAVDSELRDVMAQTPTESTVAQLEVLTTMESALDRQAQLGGYASRDLSSFRSVLNYVRRYYQGKCQESGANSIDLLIAARQLFGFVRQSELLGLPVSPTFEAAIIAEAGDCFKRARFEVDGSIDATLGLPANVGTGSVKVTADHTRLLGQSPSITNQTAALSATDQNLTFDSATATAAPVLAGLGESASVTSTSGVLSLGLVNYDITWRIRCDKNRQFVRDKKMELHVTVADPWRDAETITFTGPITVPPQQPDVAGGAWAEVYGPGKANPPVRVPVDDPARSFQLTRSGTNFSGVWSFSVTMSARSLPGA
jgi:hypothetical protein